MADFGDNVDFSAIVAYAEQEFGFESKGQRLSNGSANTGVDISWDGVNDHGTLEFGGTLALDDHKRTSVWVRQNAAPGGGSHILRPIAW